MSGKLEGKIALVTGGNSGIGLAPAQQGRVALSVQNSRNGPFWPHVQLVPGVPLVRMGQPDEIAEAAVLLASDHSSYIAGIEQV